MAVTYVISRLILTLLFLSGKCLVDGYSSGELPDFACVAMEPRHAPNSAQTIASPYTISVASTTYRPGDTIQGILFMILF